MTRHAFTLVELLVTIAVIALLIGIALPVLAGARGSAQRVHCQANQRSLAQALAAYRLENRDRFPVARYQPSVFTNFVGPFDELAALMDHPLPRPGPDGLAERLDPWQCPADTEATESTGFGQVYALAAMFGSLPTNESRIIQDLWARDPSAVVFLCTEPAHPGRGHAQRNAARADGSVGRYAGSLLSVR